MDASLDRTTNDPADSLMKPTPPKFSGEAVEQPSISQSPREEDHPHATNTMALAMRRHRNVLSPVFKLPDDVLSRIMILERDNSDAALAKDSHSLRWLSATLVCRRWRTLALGSPLLWNFIHWNAIYAPPEDWIITCIRRSADVPLDLDLRIYHLDSDLQNLLISHSFRWRNVVFRTIFARTPSLLRKIRVPTPLLESFKVIWDEGCTSLFDGSRGFYGRGFLLPENLFGGYSPNLHQLVLDNPIHMHPNSPILPSLTWLEVYRNLPKRNMLAVLASASNLTSLRIIRLQSMITLADYGGTIYEPIRRFSRDDTVQLRRLQDLNIWSSLPFHCIHLLTHLNLPVLRRLGIAVVHMHDSDEIVPLLDAVVPLAHTVQRNEGPIHGIFIWHHNISGFAIAGWSLAQSRKMNHTAVGPEGRYLCRTVRFKGKPTQDSMRHTVYFCYDGIVSRDSYIRVFETACRRIPLDLDAVRALTLAFTVEYTCAEWHLALGHLLAVESLELFEYRPIWLSTLLEAATPNVGEQSTFLFPRLKKLVFSGQIRLNDERSLEDLQRLAKNRKAEGIPIEIDFNQCTGCSEDVVTTLQGSAKVTWNVPFRMGNFEQVADVEGQGVWGDIFDL